MKIICGVDVSKARLDACIEPGAIRGSFRNDRAGIAALAAFCRQQRVELVAMEATGGYERRAFLLLWEEGLPCAITNARNVRQYAEAMGALEKTDEIDASIIARFARARDLRRRRCRARPSSASRRLWQGSGRSPMISPCRSSAAPACSITSRCWPASTK